MMCGEFILLPCFGSSCPLRGKTANQYRSCDWSPLSYDETFLFRWERSFLGWKFSIHRTQGLTEWVDEDENDHKSYVMALGLGRKAGKCGHGVLEITDSSIYLLSVSTASLKTPLLYTHTRTLPDKIMLCFWAEIYCSKCVKLCSCACVRLFVQFSLLHN